MVSTTTDGKKVIAGTRAAKDYAEGQRAWFAARGIPAKELDAYLKGVEDGYKRALADMQLHGIISTWH